MSALKIFNTLSQRYEIFWTKVYGALVGQSHFYALIPHISLILVFSDIYGHLHTFKQSLLKIKIKHFEIKVRIRVKGQTGQQAPHKLNIPKPLSVHRMLL